MYEWGKEEVRAFEQLSEKKKFFRFQGAGVETQSSLFEKEFAQKIEASYSIVLTSGTNALVAALKAAEIEPGDEVIIPSFTFFATAAAVVQAGGVPVIVNVDEGLGMDVEEMRAAITSRTKAIIPVHMDGLPCKMDQIQKIAREKKIFLIEDVAQAVGGSFQGKRLGSFGDAGCFSFNEDKIITAGEGGAMVCQKRSDYERAFAYHDVCCQFGATMKNQFSEIVPGIGASMRVSEISSALLRVQLEKLDPILSQLRRNKSLIVERLNEEKISYIQSHCPEGDCGTSLHLKFSDPSALMFCGRELLREGFKINPISTRPAHVVWQWLDVLKNSPSHISPSDRKRLYQKALFVSSIDLLSRTLKVVVPYLKDETQMREKCEKLVTIAKNYRE